MFKKILPILSSVVMLLGNGTMTTKIYAENDTDGDEPDIVLGETDDSVTYRSSETGTINIHYFDDSEEKVPVVGSEWAIVKIADIETTVEEGDTDGLFITSYIPGYEVTSDSVATLSEYPSAEDVMPYFQWSKVTESLLSFEGKLKDGTQLEIHKGKTDANGQLTFTDLSEGVYLGIEVDAVEYHLVSDPFLISIPYTDDTIAKESGDVLSSHMVYDINPKPYLAGHLKIKKDMPWGYTIDNEWFSFTLTLPTGYYAYTTPDGESGILNITNESNGKNDHAYGTGKFIQDFKPMQEITIYDLPAGRGYIVEEAEANQADFRTEYDNCEGNTTAKTTEVATVKNYLSGLTTTAYNDMPDSADRGYDIVYPTKDAIISDKILYQHLVPHTEYTVKGEVHLLDEWGCDTGTILATASKTFTTPAANGQSSAGETVMGYVVNTFTFDASQLDGQKVVIYEYLYQGDKKLVEHADCSDEQQQILITKDSSLRRRRVRTDAGSGVLYWGLGLGATCLILALVIRHRRLKG